MKNDKVKFNSKKENEVLIDVFLRKSFDELTRIWLVLDFDEMKNDKNWRKYIEYKLKVLMWVNDRSCFDEELEKFYKKNILNEFLEKKWFNKFNMYKELILSELNLEEYFSKKIENDRSENIFILNDSKKVDFIWFVDKFKKIKKWKKVSESISFYDKNWLFAFIDYDNNLILAFKYRLIINFNINVIVKRIKWYLTKDFILLWFKNKNNIKTDLGNFLLSKVDLTQDIQEIKINQKIEDFSNEFNKMFDND